MGKGWERPDGLLQRSPATASRHKQLKLVPLYELEDDAVFPAKKEVHLLIQFEEKRAAQVAYPKSIPKLD